MTQYATDPAKAAPAPNAAALWALIVGLTGLVAAGLGFVAVFAFGIIGLLGTLFGGVLGLAAIVLGIIGLIKPGRKAMAIGGLVSGALTSCIIFLTVISTPILTGMVGTTRRIGPTRDMRGNTISDISNIKTALGIFEADIGRYPTTKEGLDALMKAPASLSATWRGPYLEKYPADKWGHPYIYLCPGMNDPASYDLSSAGPDGIPGNADDITKNTEY